MPAAEPASIVASVPDEANGAIPAESQSPVDEAGMDKLRSLVLGPAEKQLAEVQRSIEASPPGAELRDLLQKKQDLMRQLAAAR